LLKFVVHESKGHRLTVEDHAPLVVDVRLTGVPLLPVLGQVGSSRAVRFAIRALVKGTRQEGVLVTAVLHRESTNVHTGSHSVLIGPLVAEDT